MRRVVIHIEELRLHGFNETDGAEIREAIAREFARVLAGPGALAGCRDISLPRLSLEQVTMREETAVSDVGTHIAQGICGRLME